ncbi:hypothetical protein [Ralstonia solanacearum]|uniref:hypothetical protein n=1 Tax=Ralstonia solanacearum TaxID=305 RepID=UPI002E1A67D5
MVDGVEAERKLRMPCVLHRDEQIEELGIAAAERLPPTRLIRLQLCQALPHRVEALQDAGLACSRDQRVQVRFRRCVAHVDR